MAFSTIRYNECKQSSYRAIELSYVINGEEVTKLFDTGNFIVDYYDFMHFLENQDDAFYKENPYIGGSSSWDHFIMDGNKYCESYFDVRTGEFVSWAKALDDGDIDLYNKIMKYPKVFHLTSQKSFNAVKAYYKRKTKHRNEKEQPTA